ncbi:MAG TPA: hypothetical protein VL285_09825 [Bryobacteraceae bacterium]|jgi:hypothetical protein|nr:hypothetical protein [Bryobacteraceae bacterium]
MLAYVFWHQPADPAASDAYEELLRRFHRALAESAPDGFIDSASFALTGIPWLPPGAGYLDWYNVSDFPALGVLNEAAVAGARKIPHDEVASRAGIGFGGLYRLISGRPDLEGIAAGTWLRKPDGMGYPEFRDRASALADPSRMGLWQRQMSLGPGHEFCLLGPNHAAAPDVFGPLAVDLRILRP